MVEAIWGYEKWLLSSVKGRESVLLGDASVTLNSLAASLKEKLLGRKVWQRYCAEFPLLIKFIHTHDKLSVQVHPSDAQAALMNKKRSSEEYKGKTEMWYITEAQKDASFMLGFSGETASEELKRKISDRFNIEKNASQRKELVEELLAKVHPRAGESYFVPAGTVHSLGAGLNLIEIQQSSNTTFRLYDFDRIDKNTGKPRRLDVEEALQCIDYSNVKKNVALHGTVSCEHFTTNPVSLSASEDKEEGAVYSLNLNELDSFSIVIVTEGEGQIEDERIAEGDLLLIPASAGSFSVSTQSSVKFLEVHI